MKYEDIVSLSSKAIYEFRFYHGRIEGGIIVCNPEKHKMIYYLVKASNLAEWRNAVSERKKEFMEEINIETINFWKPINRNL